MYNIYCTSYHVIVSTYHMINECPIIIDINYTGSQEQVVGNDTYNKEFNDFPLLCKLFSICLFTNLLRCPFSKSFS